MNNPRSSPSSSNSSTSSATQPSATSKLAAVLPENHSFQILYAIDNKFNDFKNVIAKYIRDECYNIDNIMEEYVEKQGTSLFAICDIGRQNETFIQYQKEHWVIFVIVSQNGKFTVFIKDSPDTEEYNLQKLKLKKLIEDKLNTSSTVEFIERTDKEESTVNGSDISIAFNNLKTLMDGFENGKEEPFEKQFKKISFCSAHCLTIDLDKLIVEIGLSSGFKFRLKPALQKILSALQRVTEKNERYKPEHSQIMKLSETLENKNFSPKEKDEINLKEIVIDLMIIFKERGQIIDEIMKKKIKKYFDENTNRYIRKIDEFDKTLRQDSRSSQMTGCLGLALKDLLKFVNSIEKLIPDSLTIEQLDVLFKLLGDNNEQKTIADDKIQLENELNSLVESDAIMNINYKLSDIRHQLDYFARKSEAISMISINDLIILLGSKTDNSESVKRNILSQETLDRVVEVGKTRANKDVALAIIKILNFMNLSQYKITDEEIDGILSSTLSQITQDHAKLVLILRQKLKLNKNPDLLRFIYKILIDNEDKQIRSEAFNILRSYELDSSDLEYIINAIKLEEQCLKNHKNFLSNCLQQVKIRHKLTLNCFEQLAKHFLVNETSLIIEEIVEQSIQQLPNFFVGKFIEYIKSNSDKIEHEFSIISLGKSLLKGQYICFFQLQNFIEKLIDNENININVFDLLSIEVKNEHLIPTHIVDKLKHAAKNNGYAANLIKLIEKRCDDIDILNNPRESLTKRKEALKKIEIDTQYHTSDTIQTLQLLVKYDLDLRADCFKALVGILPQDYIKNKIKIDFDGIAECIAKDETISVDDIRRLVKKDTTVDLSHILTFIIHRIEIDRTATLHFLSEISHLKVQRELNDIQITFLLVLVFESTDFDFREKIMSILESIVAKEDSRTIEIVKQTVDGIEIRCSLVEELNKIRDSQKLVIDQHNLPKLREMIEDEEYAITEDQVKLLADALGNAEKQDLHGQISDILLQIHLRHRFTNTIASALLNIIHENPNLIGIDSIAGIVAIGFTKKRVISDEIVEGLWQQLKKSIEEKTVKYNLICAIRVVVAQRNRITEKNLEAIANYLTSQNVDIQIRLVLVDILSNVIEQNDNEFEISFDVIESLKTVVLQPKNSYNEYLLNRIVFRILKGSIEENDSAHVFLSGYYKIFKQQATSLEEYSINELSPLDQYMDKKYSAIEKFHLINVLNNTFLRQQRIDTSIFNEFHESEWRKEILCSDLLAGVILEMDENEGVDEFELQLFRENLNSLSLLTNEQISIEIILQELLDKQVSYKLNIEIINEILIMLQSIEDGFNILKQKSNNFYTDLRKLWLREKLKYFAIECSAENLEIFNACVPYRISLITSILERVTEDTTIEELINFLYDLSKCGLAQNSIENFLMKDIPDKKNISVWQLILIDRLIGSVLSEKFPIYKKYLKYNKLEFDKINFMQNAYNQTNTTYCYTAEDLAKISSQWMKEFSTSFIITQQDDRSLDVILSDVSNEYKREKRPSIILLNIANNHWVIVALINYEDKDIALYKDSLGDCHRDEREKFKTLLTVKIENIDIKFHRSSEQSDSHNSGVFALANMKIMATQLRDKREDFIRNYEKHRFTSQKEALVYRTQTFPKMYALSLCQPYRKRKVINHHSAELESIRDTLAQKALLKYNLQLSIDLPQEENLLENNYRYLYVIKVSQEVDFSCNSESKQEIIQALGITEVYSAEKNIFRIANDKLTVCNEKKEKLDLNELIIQMSDNDIDELLHQLGIELTEFNRDMLKKNLGFAIKIYSTTQSKELVDIEDYELVTHLHKKLTKIVLEGWSIKSIRRLIENIDSEDKLKHLLNALDPIYEYSLKEYDSNIEGNTLFDILKSTSIKKWINTIHELAIFQTFKGSFNKDLEKLQTELYEINKDNQISFLCDEKLIAAYKNILTTYKCKSKLFDNFNTIKHWESKEIKQWAEKVKLTPNIVTQHEKLAVIKRGIEITSKFPPREIQLLSVLILTNREENTGRLSQINTGEGKTTIVAMLAAITALDGHKVDVVTSSPELAKPQAKQQQTFFEQFGLTVSDNSKSTGDIKKCYRADIVYGAAGDFQGDILRDEYSKLGTRSGRKCDVAIVDEVDSMLIDGKNHIVMLSSPMPAMDHLEPLLAAIWIQIEEVAKSIKEVDDKTYFIEQEDMINETGKIKSDIIEHAILIEGTKENFIKNCTEKHVRKLLRDKENLPATEVDIPSEYPEIKIPTHLRCFVTKSQLTKWIDSAIYAKYRCENNKHYIIKDQKIAPVDANNTGIVQQNMHWNNGLHQFLQIKHGAKISAESLSTNFISNVTYFKRYNKNIYGLTGTLGSIRARQLLNKTYSVDCVIIPPFRQKQYKELTPLITNNENNGWYSTIVESCMNKLKNGRGVLVITKYIKEVDELKNRLKTAGCEDSKIKVYKTEEDATSIEEHLKPGEIIIATNIAGRGTDIKAGKIEQNGGLHVCVTFLPPSERVEQQNVGRTSRMGNKGTSQFIVLEKSEYEFNVLRHIRNRNEEDELEKAEIKIKKVLINDAIFTEFCKLLDEIDDKQDASIKTKVRAVEERFGIWLKMQEDNIAKIANKEKVLEEFKEFKKEILDDKIKHKLIQNPYFHILIGNQLLEEKKYKAAIEEFTRAIDLDTCFQANAYYNRGYARIAEYGSSAKAYKEEIRKAVVDFKQAKQIIEDSLEPMLHIIQKASNSDVLSEQVFHKMTLFGMQKNAIEMAIGTDVDKEINALKSQQGQTGISQADFDTIKQQIEKLEASKGEREKGVISQALEKGTNLKIELLAIEKSLPEDQDVNLYKEEIAEYRNNGFIGCFQVKEVKPIDWLSVIALMALGLAQIVGGAVLTVYTLGAGSSIGMGLLSEGISDLITAVKDGIINRDFNWVAYGIQKAISITVSLVCAGLGAIKDAAKATIAGVKQVGSIIASAATQTVKAGWKIAAKVIGTELAKGVAKQVVTQLVDYGINKSLMPSIHDEVMKRVEGPIQDALLRNPIVEKMLQLDGYNRNNYYQNLIKVKAMELLNPQNKSEHALLTITKGICKGIASNKIPGLSNILQIKEAVEALDELRKFLPGFIKNLNEAINEISEKENVSKRIEDFNKQQSETQSQMDKEKLEIKENTHSIYTSNYSQEQHIEDINLELIENQEEQISIETKSKSPEGLRQDLVKSVTVNMCNIIKSKLVTPVSNAGVSFGMRKLTAGLDKNIQDQIGNYQAERRIEFFQNRDKENRIPHEFKKGNKDREAVAKADKMIDDIKNGGEAGLPHLGPLSDEAGRPIKVLDEKGRVVRIIGEYKGGSPIEIEYHKPTRDNPQGHWTLPGGKEPTVNNSGKNNCLFNVIAQQIEKDPNQIREDMAARMENNKEKLANQARDIKRLEQYKKSALTMGGAQYSGASKNDAKYVLNQSQGNRPQRDPKKGRAAKGHPRGHASDPSKKKNPPGEDCVEDYSLQSGQHGKSAFSSYEDQDYYVHQALKHKVAQDAMTKLNAGSYEEVVRIPIKEFAFLNGNSDIACNFKHGRNDGSNYKPSKIVLDLRHQQDQYKNPAANVHVQTTYLDK